MIYLRRRGGSVKSFTAPDVFRKTWLQLSIDRSRRETTARARCTLEARMKGAIAVASIVLSARFQDVLTKRLCSIFSDLSGPLYVNPVRAKFVWFYSKAEESRFEFKASSLERNFLDLLRFRVASAAAVRDRIRKSLRDYMDDTSLISAVRPCSFGGSLGPAGSTPTRMRHRECDVAHARDASTQRAARQAVQSRCASEMKRRNRDAPRFRDSQERKAVR
jgi:hypothetical protein